MENGPFTDDFPNKTSIYNGFSIAMLNYQRVINSLGIYSRMSPYKKTPGFRFQLNFSSISNPEPHLSNQLDPFEGVQVPGNFIPAGGIDATDEAIVTHEGR